MIETQLSISVKVGLNLWLQAYDIGSCTAFYFIIKEMKQKDV